MVKRMQRLLNDLSWWLIFPVLAFGILLLFCAPAWGKSRGPYMKEARDREPFYRPGNKGVPIVQDRRKWRGPKNSKGLEKEWREDEGLSPEEKARLNRKFKAWKSLPPEKQKLLRRRMKQWRELPPKERERYRQRFDQWQRLSPQERESIRKRLDKWNRLSPEEQEQIRRKFR